MIFRQQARQSAPSTIGIPASDTQGVIGKIQEVTPDNRTGDSGKPLVPSQEQAIQSITPLFSSGKQGSHVECTFGAGEVGPAENKVAPSEQPTSGKPRKQQTVVPATDQIKKQPTIIGQQDAPHTREVLTSEDVLGTTPTHGDSKPSTPDALGSRPGDVVWLNRYLPHQVEIQFILQNQPSLLVQGTWRLEIQLLQPQLISSTNPSKGDAIVVVPDQAKDFQTTPSQQDLLFTQRPSGKVQENVPGEDSGKDKPLRPSSAVREGQDSSYTSQPPSSSEARSKDIGNLAPSTQLNSTTEATNGDAIVAALDQAKDSQIIPGNKSNYLHHPIIPSILQGHFRKMNLLITRVKIVPVLHSQLSLLSQQKKRLSLLQTNQTSTLGKVVNQNDMTPAPDKEKTLFSGTPYASRETKKSTYDDHIDEKHPGQGQVSPYTHVSEPPHGPTPEVHSDVVIKETTFGSSQAETSKTRPDSTPVGGDARLSSGDARAASSLPETQDLQDKSPGHLSSDQALAPIMSASVPSVAPLDSVQSPRKASMEYTVDLRSVPDAQHGIPQGKATPAEKKVPVSELEPPLSVEPRKQEANAAAGDQPNVLQGPERAVEHQVKAASSDAREALQKDQQPSHAVLPEQTTHNVPSDLDRSTPEVGSTVVDKETRLLSSQAQTSATELDSTLTSGDVSPTSSIQNEEAQPPVTTQAPTTQSLRGSAPTQDDPLKKSESPPRRSSIDQVMAPRTRSAAPSGLPHGTEPEDNAVVTAPGQPTEIITHEQAIASARDTAKTPFPRTDQEVMAPIAEPMDPQLAGTLPAEVAYSKQNSAPSDLVKGSASVAEPLSPVEPKKADSNVSAADYTNAPQTIFRQQAKPSAPSKIVIPASDTQGAIEKIQEGTPDNRRTDDSGEPSVPNQEYASLAIPGQEEMTSPPDTKVSPISATNLAKEVQEVSPDNQQAIESITPLYSNGKQGSRVGSAYGPGEVGPFEKKFAPSDQELPHSAEQPTSGKPRKEQIVVPAAEQIKKHPTIIGQQETPDAREAPTSDVLDTTPTHGDIHSTGSIEQDRRPLSVQGEELTSATQAPAPHMARDSKDTGHISTDASVQSLKMAPDARGITPGSTPGHVSVAEQIYSPSGTNSVQPSKDASLDFSSDEKPTTAQGFQSKTPNDGLSTSQVVGQSESADSKWMDSHKNFKGASSDENSKKQQQIEQFDTRFKDDDKETGRTVRSNITTTFEEPPEQPSWPMGSMESSDEPENQQQTDQAVQSLEGNGNQAKQTKAHGTEMGEPEDMEASNNTNQKINRISQVQTLDHSGKEASGVQLLGKNTKDAPNSTEDAPGDVQAISKSKERSRLSEETKVQLNSEDKIGETESPSAETGQPREGGLPENSYQNNSSQSQAEASDKSVQQTYPGIQNKDRDSSRLEDSTDPTKPGDMED
ncbi:hypothetical protein HU200_033957 [Digitaria exilis]|uniref:Uncharacterized protein n=1 Tax=Digitaria exilis TaxID=1010633 RepID=A0A835EMT3_9POAL|nr:hypothetical protein HU200_033957 [Digitaria exilis]